MAYGSHAVSNQPKQKTYFFPFGLRYWVTFQRRLTIRRPLGQKDRCIRCFHFGTLKYKI